MFDAKIRVALTTAGDPDRSYWYVDVLSDQWAGVPIASCVQTWGSPASHRRSAHLADHPSQCRRARTRTFPIITWPPS